MPEMTNEMLISKAESVVNARKIGDYLVGDVGAALVTAKGNLYLGVCMDISSGIGFCAEHSAIAAMVTAGEYQIAKIVAVWKDADGTLYVMPPSGRCREFIRQVDPANIDTQVVISREATLSLRNCC